MIENRPSFKQAVAAFESVLPPPFDTRTQYDRVAVSGGVVNVLLFVPTGVVATPLAPSNH